MGNTEIPVLYTYMVPCVFCTFVVSKQLWHLFFKGSILLILHKKSHVDNTEHLDGEATLNNLAAAIVRYSNCNILQFNNKVKKVLPLKVKQILFIIIASNMIKIKTDTKFDNNVF